MNFIERERFNLETATEVYKRPSNTLRHLLDNGDGTYSVMGHIVCEWCDYCEVERNNKEGVVTIHSAQENPYEKVGR